MEVVEAVNMPGPRSAFSPTAQCVLRDRPLNVVPGTLSREATKAMKGVGGRDPVAKVLNRLLQCIPGCREGSTVGHCRVQSLVRSAGRGEGVPVSFHYRGLRGRMRSGTPFWEMSDSLLGTWVDGERGGGAVQNVPWTSQCHLAMCIFEFVKTTSG
jgi:hypothetical protein